jgi:hypothetical protein
MSQNRVRAPQDTKIVSEIEYKISVLGFEFPEIGIGMLALFF